MGEPTAVGQQRRRVGIRDVAARAGVGIATVSRVLSGSTDVRADLRERVLAAATELDYQPDILAQSLRRGASRSVGFIADDLANHTIADIATGAESVLRAHDYSLLVMNSELDATLDAANIRVLKARRVDALMMCPVEENDRDTVEALRELGAPLCIIEGDQPPVVRASYVHSDHRGGAAAALRHLLSLGHRHVALLTGPTRYRSARERLQALRDVAVPEGSAARLVHREVELDAAASELATRALLSAEEPPTALVVGGVRLLLGVLRGIDAAGLELGSDLSLIIADPGTITTVFRPPLASITRDSIGLGRFAAQLLLARIADPSLGPESVLLPTTYEPRASVAPPHPQRSRVAVASP